MASCDGSSLEYWIYDSVYNVSEDTRAKIVTLLEPFRESIETQISMFKEDTQSWRDYRNAMWYSIPEEIDEQVTNIIKNNH